MATPRTDPPSGSGGRQISSTINSFGFPQFFEREHEAIQAVARIEGALRRWRSTQATKDIIDEGRRKSPFFFVFRSTVSRLPRVVATAKPSLATPSFLETDSCKPASQKRGALSRSSSKSCTICLARQQAHLWFDFKYRNLRT